jgi:flavin reductase (DIM6/NTAB) family NADH-FMN oxidoreductase RutF
MIREKMPMCRSDAIMSLPPSAMVIVCAKAEEVAVATVDLFTVLSFMPSRMGFGISPSRREFATFRKASDFTLNFPSVEMLEDAVALGSRGGKADIDLVPGMKVRSPAIMRCPLSIECVKEREIDLGDRFWFIGNVVHSEGEEGLDRGDLLTYWDGEVRVPGKVLLVLRTNSERCCGLHRN